MMKKGVIILFIMMGFFLVAKAQEDGKMVLTGTVVDSQTNEPVAFANLGLLGTVAGVASDMDGNFELRIPDKYAIHVVRVSAVGYASVEYKAYELRVLPFMMQKVMTVQTLRLLLKRLITNSTKCAAALRKFPCSTV